MPDHHPAVLERHQRGGNEVVAVEPLDEVGLVGPAEGGAVEGGDCRVVPGAFLGDGDHRPSIEALRIGGHDPGRASCRAAWAGAEILSRTTALRT